MSKRSKSATKPPWDESIPGHHPAFRPPTKSEIEAARKAQREAVELANSMGAGEITRRQQWLAQAHSRENLHRTNLEYFLAAKPRAVGGKKTQANQITLHRYGLVCALRDLGKFSEALDIASSVSGRTRHGFAQIADQIVEWDAAIASDDNAEHACERVTHTVTTKNLPNSPKETATVMEYPRRHTAGWVVSHKHGGEVVDIWECSVCHELNAHDQGPPEHQQELHRLRKLVESGQMVNARGKPGPGPEHMDQVIFKK